LRPFAGVRGAVAVGLFAAIVGQALPARAEEPRPDAEPTGHSGGPGSGNPAPAPPPQPSAPGGTPDAHAELLERLRKLEEIVKEQKRENAVLSKKYEELSRKLQENTVDDEALAENEELTKRVDALSHQLEDRAKIDRDKEDRAASQVRADETSTTGSAAGGGGGFRNRAGAQVVGNRQIGNIGVRGVYDYDNAGYKFFTEDREFNMRVRGVFQGDARLFTRGNQDPVSSGFYIPRARLYFTGQMTKPIQYQLSFEHGYDSFNILNAFVNFDYDKRLQFRVGRFKVPYTYEYYKISFMDLLAPERSVYNNSFALNRSVGAQFWGELFDKRVEYALGVFDGARKTYQPYGNNADLAGLLNFTPFVQGNSALKHLNVGGSGDFGHENNPLDPAVLRPAETESNATLASTSAANTASVPILSFNDNVREKGARSLWDVHLAYFYKSLALLGSWSSGFDSWAAGDGRPVRVPVDGYFIQAGYILTGETLTESTVIDPLHPFDIRPGRFGLGAIQPQARFSALTLGRDVFTGGLADPNLWTNQVYMVDAGFNWYLNKFTKVYFDWEHLVFGDPVYYRPGRLQKTSDMLWMRLQFIF
jgi:phosphate-selective porin OprO/OprP